MSYKVGDILKSDDGETEIEILDYDLKKDEYKYVIRDSYGISMAWADPDSLDMLIQVTNAFPKRTYAPGYKPTCYHPNKEKKLCFNLYYWVCKDCGQEFENE
jgi:hypothetical protein